MIFDKFLMENLSKFVGITEPPKNLDEVYGIFKKISDGLENNNLKSHLIGNVFYYFISSEEVRDRKVTSRVFEDIVASLLKGNVLDNDSKPNPNASTTILKYDEDYKEECSSFGFSISQDLAGNKREKADNRFGNYSLSIKTLKGKLYDRELELIDNSYNKELNIGSLSYRALLVGLLSNSDLEALSDRRGGLGSKTQLIKSLYHPLNNNGKWNDFIKRLEDFLKYIYSESDFLLVFKSGYKMDILFIKEKDFIEELISLAKEDYNEFFTVFYRWENNNLRLHYSKLVERLSSLGKIQKISLNFNNCLDNSELILKINNICKYIEDSLNF